jgi:hypothetical protein
VAHQGLETTFTAQGYATTYAVNEPPRSTSATARSRTVEPAAKPPVVGVMHTRFLNAQSTAAAVAGERMPGIVHTVSATGQRVSVPTYADMTMTNIYQGIDVQFSDDQGQLKSTWTIAPGSDPATIRWRYDGVDSVRINQAGDLILTMPRTRADAAQQQLTERAPIAWQDINDQRIAIGVRYALDDRQTVGFTLDQYDARYPLIIDPTLGYFDVFLNETILDITTDANGSVYLTGVTLNGSSFLEKRSVQGTVVDWRTIHNVATDRIGKLAVSPNGEYLYAVRYTYSTLPQTVVMRLQASDGLPVNERRISDSSYADADDIHVGPTEIAIIVSGSLMRLTPNLTTEIAIHTIPDVDLSLVTGDPLNASHLYVAGQSPTDDYIYLAQFNADGTIANSTTLDGSDNDLVMAMAVQEDTVYVAGYTHSPDFPLVHPLQGATSAVDMAGDGFIAAYSFSLNQLSFSTYLGGMGEDIISDIGISGSGAINVTGFYKPGSSTETPGFPLYQPIPGSEGITQGVFVTRLIRGAATPTRYEFDFSTFLENPNLEWPALSVVGDRIYVASSTATNSGLLVRLDLQPPPGGDVININFQPETMVPPAGYLADSGAAYGNRGNGWSYGWTDTRWDTRPHMEAKGGNSIDPLYGTMVTNTENKHANWRLGGVPDGTYRIRLVLAGSRYVDTLPRVIQIHAEERLFASTVRKPAASTAKLELVGEVRVVDGALDLTWEDLHEPEDATNADVWIGFSVLEISKASNQSNQPPQVTITDPVPTTMSEGQILTFRAAATDPDGTIARVDFYDNGILIGSDAIEPFEITRGCIASLLDSCPEMLALGGHTLSARAIDNEGSSSVATKSITVQPQPQRYDEYQVEVKMFIPYNYAALPATHPQSSQVGLADDRGYSSTSQMFRMAQRFTVIPDPALDTDGLKAGTAQTLAGLSISYDKASSLDPFSGRLHAVARSEPLTPATKDIPWMMDYGSMPDPNAAGTIVAAPRDPATPKKAHITFSGWGEDVNFSPNCNIDWDMEIFIDTDGRVQVLGTHNRFPAYEIYVNGIQVYRFMPHSPDDIISLCGSHYDISSYLWPVESIMVPPTLAWTEEETWTDEGQDAVAVIRLQKPAAQEVRVNFTTRDGSAIGGKDYGKTSGTVVFAPGETLKTIKVRTLPDIYKESYESFFIDLSMPTHGVVGTPATIRVTINPPCSAGEC